MLFNNLHGERGEGAATDLWKPTVGSPGSVGRGTDRDSLVAKDYNHTVVTERYFPRSRFQHLLDII